MSVLHAETLVLPWPVRPQPRCEGRKPALGRLRAGSSASSAPSIAPEILDRCRGGDPEAFDVLFETFKDHVYTLALHFSGDESVAADVTQDVFLKLLDRIGQFRRDAEFTTWLYRIVLNTFLDHRKARRPWLSLDESSERPELLLEATQEQGVAAGEMARVVRRAVAGLRPHLRGPLVLRYSAGLTYDEIAGVLDISPGTVASRLSRAHRALARKLGSLRSPA